MKKLLIDVSKIPLEGLEVDADLDEEAVHLEGEESFILVGGRLRCRLERETTSPCTCAAT